MDRILRKILTDSLHEANRIDDALGNTTESYRQQMTVLFAAISFVLDTAAGRPQDDDGPLTSLAALAEWLRSVEL